MNELNILLEHPSLEIGENRRLLIEYVRELGTASSDAVLDPACKAFTLPGVKGMIGYRDDSPCAVVYGDPICTKVDRPKLVQAFHDFCHEKGINVIYVATTEDFSKWAIDKSCKGLIEFGEELVIDPHEDPCAQKGDNGCLVRKKVRHAIKDGVEVIEYTPFNTKIEEAIQNVGKSWLNGRQGFQVHISHIRLFDDRFGKRWFYAKKQEKVIGVVMLNQLQAQQGWLLNHLMFTQDAPGGTPELLLTTVFEKLAEEGCHFVTFGAVASPVIGEMIGFGSVSQWLSRLIFQGVNKIFHLDGRKKFWSKFKPESKRCYLLFKEPKVGPRELVALTRAMNIRRPKH